MLKNRNKLWPVLAGVLGFWGFAFTGAAQPLGNWIQQGNKVVGGGAAGPAAQGIAAGISNDGNTAIVGSSSAADNGAWIFVRSGGVWTQQGGKLIGSGATGAAVQQGIAVAISGDGNTAILGGPLDGNSVGAAWVFTRNGNVWTQQGGKLVGSGAIGAAQEGIGVALSNDGNTAVIGGLGDSNMSGAVWVFTRNGGVWTQQGGKLTGTGASGAANQGATVALSGDGNTLLSGGNADAGGIGATWVFTRTGSAWAQQGNKLVGSGGSADASQSYSLALSADGNTALIGGPFDNNKTGAAWIFVRNGGGWSQQGPKLVGTGATGGASQGFSGGLSADGNYAIVGGPDDNGSKGAVWSYGRTGTTWAQIGNKVTGTGSVDASLQGFSSALSGDGRTMVVGGPGDFGATGAAWFFVRTPLGTGTPSPVSLNPAVSTGSSVVLTVNYNAPAGAQTLEVVNVLINTALDGRQACYLAYARAANALYIVADNGDAAQLSGKAMDGTGTVGNSQCTVNLAGSSAISSGTTLTLTLAITFSTSFGGNRVIYAAARDAQNNSGWQTMGVHGVPPLPSTFPNPTAVTPGAMTTLAQLVTFTYQDQSSVANLQTVWGLINTAIDGRNACYFAYYRPGNQLYLYPDNGDGSQATNITLTGNNSIANSQCTIAAQGAVVQATGNTLNLTLPITMKTGFAGFKGIWLAAQTLGGAQTSPWQALGAWAVPAQ